MIVTSNLALRFLLELVGLAAAGYAGFASTEGPLRWPVAIAAPLALAVFWGLVVAPNATNPLGPQLRMALGSLALLGTAAALALAGRPGLATVFAVLVVANNLVLTVLGQFAVPGEAAR